jgi:hypothetical protein
VKLNRPGELQFVKQLAVKYRLVPLLERAIRSLGEFSWEYKYEPKVGDDAWHPSGDCTPSLTDLYYQATGAGEEWDRSGMLKTFQVGHFWHQYLQEIMVRANLADPSDIERRERRGWGPLGTLEAEVRYFPHFSDPILWKPYHWATGSADVAPFELDMGPRAVVDFKTMKSMDFKRMDPPAWAVDKWECQGNIYMDWHNCDVAIFVGINKDSPHELKEWEFRRNQPLIDAIYQKWELVSMCLDEGIVPPEEEEIQLPLEGPVTP